MKDDDYATDSAARLAAIGLVDEASIAENENKPHPPIPRHRNIAAMDTYPAEKLPATIREYGELDGWADAALDRPPSAAIRFIEARLHYNNMHQFGAYLAAYEAAWNKKRAYEREWRTA